MGVALLYADGNTVMLSFIKMGWVRILKEDCSERCRYQSAACRCDGNDADSGSRHRATSAGGNVWGATRRCALVTHAAARAQGRSVKVKANFPTRHNTQPIAGAQAMCMRTHRHFQPLDAALLGPARHKQALACADRTLSLCAANPEAPQGRGCTGPALRTPCRNQCAEARR